MMTNLLAVASIILVMGIVGLFFGLVLAYANKKLVVEINPLIHIVEDVLPKGQCGACGYPGCQAYAEAVVTKPEVAPNLCTPGKEAVAKKVSEITGKRADQVEERVAFLKCNNPISLASKKFIYSGIEDCVAASLLLFGPKSCQYGCLGHGTCAKNCPFDAIEMSKSGLPIINKKRCTGCGKCETVCPKNTIEMIPLYSKVNVTCNSKNKGAIAKKNCPVACIGCGICVKSCQYNAIVLVDNLPVIDKKVCKELCSDPVCVSKCPMKSISIF